MTSKSECRRMAIQLTDSIKVENGEATWICFADVNFKASTLRKIADTLDHLTALQQAKETT